MPRPVPNRLQSELIHNINKLLGISDENLLPGLPLQRQTRKIPQILRGQPQLPDNEEIAHFSVHLLRSTPVHSHFRTRGHVHIRSHLKHRRNFRPFCWHQPSEFIRARRIVYLCFGSFTSCFILLI